MKKVIIKNKLGQERSSAKMLDPTEWVASCIEKNSWGKTERWVHHKDEMHAEAYDEADVLEERDVVIQEASEHIPAIIRKEVKLKAEYSIEIIDISAEHALAECIAKRRAEYPSAEEFLNVFFDGGSAELEALKTKRLEIKAKYPKPAMGV